uniref:Uncharacterized protein n=1 Tax=Cannabis sativa TaxID=3483 RepID=A0A803NUB9_CANSA
MQTIKPLLPKALNVVSHCLNILKHSSSSKKGLRLMFMKYFEEGIQKGNRGRGLVFTHYMSVKMGKEIDHFDSDEYSKRCGRCSHVLALCHNLNTRNAGATRGGSSLEGRRGKLPWQEDEEALLDLLPKISLWAKSADYDRALPWYYKNITNIEEYNEKDLIELIEFNTISISIGDLPPLLYESRPGPRPVAFAAPKLGFVDLVHNGKFVGIFRGKVWGEDTVFGATTSQQFA